MFTTVENPQDGMAFEIRRFIAPDHPIVIASSYRGLILAHPVQLLDILPDRVIFQASDPYTCSTLRERVHLYSRTLSEVVTARLLGVNIISGKISLSDLVFSGHCWKERMWERIQPRDPIFVELTVKGILAHTHLENISATGMRVLLYRKGGKEEYALLGEIARLVFQLPRDVSKMEIQGQIMYSRRVGNLVIVGIHFVASKSIEKRLHRYIQGRRIEILDELKLAFQKMLAPRQTQDLYF